jgi:lipopolysaccharide assembly outer membrane protein LptD (OstA)
MEFQDGRERYARNERKRERTRLITALISTAVFILTVGIIFRMSDREVKQILDSQKLGRATLELRKPVMKGFNTEGQKVWEIQSEHLSVDDTTNEITFTNTVATFFDKGEESLKATVGKLVYNRDTRNMELTEGIKMVTADKIDVLTKRVIWLDYYQRFIFPEGAKLVTEEKNYLKADYLQSDRKLDHLEAVGHVAIWIKAMKDDTLIRKRELAKGEVKLSELKDIEINAEKVVYDREQQIIVATSRLYNKPFRVNAPDGTEIKVDKYQKKVEPVFFKKKEIEVFANHLEVHLDDKYANAKGNIRGIIYPSAGAKNDDKALKVLRKERTWFKTDDMDYYWGDDYVRTYSPTTVVQNNRLARAEDLTYFGKYTESGVPGTQRAMFIEGGVHVWEHDGKWIFDNKLLEEVKEKELRKIMQEEADIKADRMVAMLNRADFHAQGDVEVVQKNRRMRADEILYTDKDKKFIANGNAHFVDKEKQEFYGQQIIYYSNNEDIEVNGSGTATLKIPKKYREDIDRALERIKGKKRAAADEEAQAKPPLPAQPSDAKTEAKG